ncbi:MAG: ornithine carbamoyltransferase [Candidatus Eisenbacteria bacterium]|nr:ornithine carbamoyltransferase [Candidatus Eisenbacteria bacterium]
MQKDFLSIAQLDRGEMESLLRRAIEMKKEWKEGKAGLPLAGKTLGLIFHKPSLRTRVSFQVGMYQLGGQVVYLTDAEIGLGKREAIQDVGEVLGRYVDGIMIRTFAHSHAEELAAHAPIPVINGLTDLLHPCQILADLMTVLEHRGNLDDLTVSYFGDGNNVANSWVNAAGVLPFAFRIACPEGYEPDAEILAAARARGAGTIEVTHDAKAAAKDTDVLYADVWASMGQEAEKAARAKIFAPYQLNAGLAALARKDHLVLHCLPAHRGEEITAEVIDGSHSVIYDEAENRMHAQKAILERLMA